MPNIEAKDTELLTTDRQYISLRELAEYTRVHDAFPYRTTFSFTPYMQKMREHLCDTCDFTQSAIQPVLEQYEEHLLSAGDDAEMDISDPRFQAAVRVVLPSMILNDNLNFVSKPFVKESVVATTGFDAVYSGDKYEIKLMPEFLLRGKQKRANLYNTFILNTFYDQSLTDETSDTIVVRNKENGIERYYDLRMQLDFVEAVALRKLPELSQKDINRLLNNIDDDDMWLNVFPADMLEFRGFMIGSLVDVTEVEVISDLRQYLSRMGEDVNIHALHRQLESYLTSYLNRAGLTVGEAILDDRNYLRQQPVSLTGLTGVEILHKEAQGLLKGGLYAEVFAHKKPVYCGDLSAIASHHELEAQLIAAGYHSVILCPVVDAAGRVMNIIEIGTEQPYSFTALTVQKLEGIFTILQEGYIELLNMLKNVINGIIKDKFTSIHPSVEWKFEEVATQYYVERIANKDIDIQPILFEKLHPLYGQADIVGSSVLRSEGIREDLIENLQLLETLMATWLSKKKLHILEASKIRVEKLRVGLQEQYVASDETEVVSFITKEIHPLLEQLHSQYRELSTAAYQDYTSKLDKTAGVIYVKRRAFESSVGKVNSTISAMIEKADRKMQSVQQHYFEKYKTDGVEYNMYLGASLLQDGSFSSFDLQNFKIWQLTTMCDITREMNKLSPSLPVPLQTAQLIFVYSQPLSIRFRMDEKKFDVDGAYNVRYEILKKRIDKATILNTGERLTVAGKVAIVYLHEEDKQEYMEYLNYLIHKGYITDQIEDLMLENMQGSEGLKALRISVI